MISSSFSPRLRTPFVRSRYKGAFHESTLVHPVDRCWHYPGVDLGRSRRITPAAGQRGGTDVMAGVTPDFPDFSRSSADRPLTPRFSVDQPAKPDAQTPAIALGQPGLSFRYMQTFGVTEQAYIADVQHLNSPGGLFMDAGEQSLRGRGSRQPGAEVQCRGQ